jgi:hypothetical protein
MARRAQSFHAGGGKFRILNFASPTRSMGSTPLPTNQAQGKHFGLKTPIIPVAKPEIE